MLAASGRLQLDMYGGPVGGDAPRRSVYVRVRRNSLDPFLRVFDFPEPVTATGRRDSTNVPAQALALLNDSRVAGYAEAWANRILLDQNLRDDHERINQVFLLASVAMRARQRLVSRLNI